MKTGSAPVGYEPLPHTLDEALELFRLPRTLGEYEGLEVSVGSGRYGNYVLHDGKFTSLPSQTDPLAITLEEAITLINAKRQAEQQRHLKKFSEDSELELINGRFGPYLAYKGQNYRIAKALHSKATELTYEECMNIIREQDEKPKATGRRYSRKQ